MKTRYYTSRSLAHTLFYSFLYTSICIANAQQQASEQLSIRPIHITSTNKD